MGVKRKASALPTTESPVPKKGKGKAKITAVDTEESAYASSLGSQADTNEDIKSKGKEKVRVKAKNCVKVGEQQLREPTKEYDTEWRTFASLFDVENDTTLKNTKLMM